MSYPNNLIKKFNYLVKLFDYHSEIKYKLPHKCLGTLMRVGWGRGIP
jgi:hypothetical protein